MNDESVLAGIPGNEFITKPTNIYPSPPPELLFNPTDTPIEATYQNSSPQFFDDDYSSQSIENPPPIKKVSFSEQSQIQTYNPPLNPSSFLDEPQSSSEKIKELYDTNYKRTCFSSIWILVIIVPIIMFILLYFIEPGFIQKKEGNKYVIDNAKLWSDWALFTFLTWVLILLYVYSRGYKSNIDFCY